MSPLFILINPYSGKKAMRRQRLYLFNLLRRRNEPFVYRVTEYAGHAIELAREAVETGYRRILILGGDGTLNEAINGIMSARIDSSERKQVQIGLMPRGTGNDFARYWQLDKRYRRSLDRFFSGQQHPLDVGCLTYYRNGETHHRYFVNSIGFGVDPLTCVYADRLKPYIGSHAINYLFGLLRALRRQQPIPMTIAIDDILLTSPSATADSPQNDLGLYTMNIGNGPYSGGGIRQNPTADPTDGVLNGMMVERPTFRQIMQALPRLFNGRLTDIPFVHSWQGREINIETSKHLLVETDGILLHFTGRCQVKCLHHALQFVVAQPD